MELSEFLKEMLRDVEAAIAAGLEGKGTAYPHAETVFADIVMQHMAEVGMTSEPQLCHLMGKDRNANLRLSGWALADDRDQLDLFVSLFDGAPEITRISDSQTMTAARQCLQFLASCVEGKYASRIDESNDAFALATLLPEVYPSLEQIRIYVLTDRQANSKSFAPREIAGRTVNLEVMDIERLYRHMSEGKPRDELVVNFQEVCGAPLPCVYVPGDDSGYDYALTAVPAEALRFVYERFGARLLEANVRSFLSTTGKVNKGIRETLRTSPERFMAYNNGIVLVADEARLARADDGSPGLLWLRGMQIVNGGQTTASIYFTKRNSPETDLSGVRVPAKIIVLKASDAATEESLIADISRFANSQNAVKQSDQSANKPFHVELERLALSTFCPDGVSRWFYERAAGSYATLLEREGTTPARRRKLKESIPTSRRITKTDLAKYMNAWEQRPDLVSLGSQKNFEKFRREVAGEESGIPMALPDLNGYKTMIAKAILFRRTSAMVRPMFPAFQANISAYVVAVVSLKLGDRLDLMRIWLQQDLSAALKNQIQVWAREVNDVLHRTSGGRMVSEWAKRPECWTAVSGARLSPAVTEIPENHRMGLVGKK